MTMCSNIHKVTGSRCSLPADHSGDHYAEGDFSCVAFPPRSPISWKEEPWRLGVEKALSRYSSDRFIVTCEDTWIATFGNYQDACHAVSAHNQLRENKCPAAALAKLRETRDILLEAVRAGKRYFDLIEDRVPEIAAGECKDLTEHGTLKSHDLDVAFEKWMTISEKAIAFAEGKTGGKLPYEKPRIIGGFSVTTAA